MYTKEELDSMEAEADDLEFEAIRRPIFTSLDEEMVRGMLDEVSRLRHELAKYGR